MGVSPASIAAAAPLTNFTQLFAFPGEFGLDDKNFGGKKGANSSATLAVGAKGTLYGSATRGGSTGNGVIFQLAPPVGGGTQWTFSLVHDFGDFAGGGGPIGKLIFDRAGALYGVTSAGGTGAYGTVFKLTPPADAGGKWQKTVLYNFMGTTDGATDSGNPYAGLTFGPDGALYCTVFRLTPPAAAGGDWTETVLYSFQGGSDGVEPYIPVVFDAHGALYGAAYFGGGAGCIKAGDIAGSGCGVVFKLTPPATPGGAWRETILTSFDGAGGGASPLSLVLDPAGKTLYGTTAYGGTTTADGNPQGNGVVFHLIPPASGPGPWTEKVIHVFNFADGAIPYGGVFFGPDGALYGTTFEGGGSSACAASDSAGIVCGVIYKLKPSGAKWVEDILHIFDGSNGPAGNVTFGLGGALYGTTTIGGSGATDVGGSGNGTVFELQ